MMAKDAANTAGNGSAPTFDEATGSFLRTILEDGTLPPGVDVQEAVSSVVCTLLARLDLDEARGVLDALPAGVQEVVGRCPIHQGSVAEPFDKKEFLTRVAHHLQLTAPAVEGMTRSVLSGIRAQLPSRVANLVEGHLPQDLVALLEAGRGRRETVGGEGPSALQGNPPDARDRDNESGNKPETPDPIGGQPPEGFQLDIRTRGFDLTPAIRQYATDHVVAKLAKHASHIQAVIVRLEDTNGDKGGPDKCCRVEVVMPAENPLVVEEITGDLRAAMDLAADRIENLVQRQVEHKRSVTRAQATTS